MSRRLLLALAALAPLAGTALGQTSSPPAARPPSAGAASPSTGQRPPGSPRQPRSFAQCNRDAQARGYRGAERRHFVSRCQLGYGGRLFRRRGPAPNAAPPPG